MAFVVKSRVNIQGGLFNLTNTSKRASFIRRQKSPVKMCSLNSGAPLQLLKQTPPFKSQNNVFPIMFKLTGELRNRSNGSQRFNVGDSLEIPKPQPSLLMSYCLQTTVFTLCSPKNLVFGRVPAIMSHYRFQNCNIRWINCGKLLSTVHGALESGDGSGNIAVADDQGQAKELKVTRKKIESKETSEATHDPGIFSHSYASGTVASKDVSDYCINDAADKIYRTIVDYSNPEHKMEIALDKLGVELTTPLVVEILNKFRYEEKLAFRFFTWAGKQENYSHELQAYNEMIDILSSTKYKVKQFRIVCDLLDYMKRNNKSSVPVEKLLTILRQYTEKHLTHLHKFARKKKIRSKLPSEIYAFNLLLDALCKCTLVEDAETMFMRVKNKVKPNADTYNILFFGWCRVRNPTRGMSLLEDMIKMGHTPDNFTYNTAIDTFCKAGMITEASELLKFMRNQGSTMSSPTAKTYAIMIVALVQNDRMEEAFKVLGDMISSGCLPDVSTYKDLIECVCSVGKIEAAYKLLEEMGSKGYPPDIVTFNCFLKVLCHNNDRDEALRLYHKMIEAGCVPSVQTFNMLIVMFFKMNDVDGAFETWREMENRGCARDTETYCVMIEGLFASNDTEDACLLLEEVICRGIKLRYKKFDSFLLQLSATGNLKAIHKLSEHMRTFYNPAMARRFALNQKRKSTSLRGK